MSIRPLAAALLLALPAALPAQTITVVANRSVRPTAILGPHIRYVVTADSSDGSAMLGEIAIPPVAFMGSVRIEGAQPLARAPEPRPFADTIRFEADGRVQLLLADAASRPPMTVEVSGSRLGPGGRINITAPRWPIGRILLVTISPADIFDVAYRDAGLGIRDRIRVDDRTGFAFLTDTTTGPTTVAIGFGRATRGRIQSDVGDVVLERDFGGQIGRERRTLGALTLVVEPSRGDDGTGRAEVIFGVGNSETEATRAARTASDEVGVTPRAAGPRWRTPSGEADLLARTLFAAAGWMFDWDVIENERALPSSAQRPVVNAMDAWQGSVFAEQRGDTAALCGTYRLLRGRAGRPRAEVAVRLGSGGRYLFASDSANPEADAALVLLGYGCYAATRNAGLLRAELPFLTAAATRAAAAGGEDAAEAVERLAELEDELARLSNGQRRSDGDSLRAEAARIAAAGVPPLPGALWRAMLSEAQRGISREYGRLSLEGSALAGVSLAAAGAFVSAMGEEVFGVTSYLDHVEIAPQLGGIADDHTWQLENWLLASGDTVNFTYRPSSRAATLRITAPSRRRLVLRFPWLEGTSCVTARRGTDSERLALVAQSDGSFYVDLRGGFEAAVLTLSAAACGS